MKETSHLQAAIDLFNYKPSEGYTELLSLGLTPESIGPFFLYNKKIEKKAFGDFISDETEISQALLLSILKLLHFEGLSLNQSLTNLLEIVTLHESQRIDRIFAKFGQIYFEANPKSVFLDGESVYALSYAVLMLNTDAHNADIKNKMTLDQFFQNTKGTNKKTDFPKDFIAELYGSVVQNKIFLQD